MGEKHLHIISFDIPFPADYGGVIDVFYKIKTLSEAGIKIILHCFAYGRKEQKVLSELCEKVFYYQRDTSVMAHFSSLPYIVRSRSANALLTNLCKDEYPILFEGIHTCFFLDHPLLKNRNKLFRESNIEHEYYAQLALVEKDLLKRIYYKSESKKLKSFEKNLMYANAMLIVSETEYEYFKRKFPNNCVYYLPSFHHHNETEIQSGSGEYTLYHGNLSVSENHNAAVFLVDKVFSKISFPSIIAGKEPRPELKKRIRKYKHIQLIENPNEAEMSKLIKNAQINCLYTNQATGLKLKLLRVLYEGRHCVVNSRMIEGTGLGELVHLCDSPESMIDAIESLSNRNLSGIDVDKRKELLEIKFSNSNNASRLINLLY